MKIQYINYKGEIYKVLAINVLDSPYILKVYNVNMDLAYNIINGHNNLLSDNELKYVYKQIAEFKKVLSNF